jgi:uncharacterized membrane protein YuzA (DUF378 family)
MKALTLIATVLLIVGGLNWGLWSIAKFDLVATIFGDYSILARVIYGLVGAAAIVLATRLPAMAKQVTD